MKKGLTEVIFILDRSGSMGGLEADAPEHTMVVITTDGMENSSRRYTAPKSRKW